jgi:hypothetical protein
MALAPFGSANSNTLFLTFPTPPSYLIHNHHHRTHFVFSTSRVNSYGHTLFYSHKRSYVVTILCSASNKPSQIRYPFLSSHFIFFVLCMVMT